MGQRYRQIFVYRGRTTILSASLGFDVSSDIITSQIRKEENRSSDLLAEWNVTFLTDGTDGELILTLDDSNSEISANVGYMDLKRISGGEPYRISDETLQVVVRGTVTE